MKAASRKTQILLIISAIIIQICISGFIAVPVTGLKTDRFDALVDPAQNNPDANSQPMPVTGEKSNAALQAFVDAVSDGESGIIRGIYSEDVFEYPVMQQPASQPGFVAEDEDVVTEFAMARKYGTTGILAHNFLAGEAFFELEISDIVQIIYGDGTVESYEITEIERYQALSPNSTNSTFTDLETGETITASQLFKKVYSGDHHLTLQTCIQVGAEDSWGRIFIIAEPLA